MTDPVCVIGLDGATWDLLEPWIDGGELPTRESFPDRGAYGTLHSTVPSNTSRTFAPTVIHMLGIPGPEQTRGETY